MKVHLDNQVQLSSPRKYYCGERLVHVINVVELIIGSFQLFKEDVLGAGVGTSNAHRQVFSNMFTCFNKYTTSVEPRHSLRVTTSLR